MTSLYQRFVLGVLAMVAPALALAQPSFAGRLACAGAAATLRQGTFTLPVGRVRLSDGKACVKAIPEQSGCEWGVTLERADTWGDDAQYLVTTIETIHNSPGAWLSVLIYRCRGDRYEPVFAENYGPRGARMTLGDRLMFEVRTGEWLPADAGCCPSRFRTSTYGWDDRRQRFTLIGSQVLPVPKP